MQPQHCQTEFSGRAPVLCPLHHFVSETNVLRKVTPVQLWLATEIGIHPLSRVCHVF